MRRTAVKCFGEQQIKKYFISHFAIVSDKKLKISNFVKKLLSTLNHSVTDKEICVYTAHVSVHFENL